MNRDGAILFAVLALGMMVSFGAAFFALSYSPIYTGEYWTHCADRCGDFGEPYRAMFQR